MSFKIDRVPSSLFPWLNLALKSSIVCSDWVGGVSYISEVLFSVELWGVELAGRPPRLKVLF